MNVLLEENMKLVLMVWQNPNKYEKETLVKHMKEYKYKKKQQAKPTEMELNEKSLMIYKEKYSYGKPHHEKQKQNDQ